MATLTPTNWRKLQLVKDIVEEILDYLETYPIYCVRILAFSARADVLLCFSGQVGPRLEHLASTPPYQASEGDNAIFATLYSRYLALATDIINHCSALGIDRTSYIFVTIRDRMEELLHDF